MYFIPLFSIYEKMLLFLLPGDCFCSKPFGHQLQSAQFLSWLLQPEHFPESICEILMQNHPETGFPKASERKLEIDCERESL